MYFMQYYIYIYIYIYIGVYFEVSHRIVVYRHVSVCILKDRIVLSCIATYRCVF